MVRVRPGWLAVMALLSASALAGCATDRTSRQSASANNASASAEPIATVQSPATSNVRLASFAIAASANDLPKPQTETSVHETQRPAEVVVAPDAEALDGGRHALPLDLPTA